MNSSDVKGAMLTVIFLTLYFVPTIVAAIRQVRGIGQVVVVNLFLGWSGIGWIVALVMAFRHVPQEQ